MKGGGVEGGHYICYERSPGGKMTRHSDTSRTILKNEIDFGVTGSILRLVKVPGDETILQS